jgi:hypothetical protein
MNKINYPLCETVIHFTALFVEFPYLPRESSEMVKLIVAWAEEFEALNSEEQWLDREYIAEANSFCESKYCGWLEATSGFPVPVEVTQQLQERATLLGYLAPDSSDSDQSDSTSQQPEP